MGYAFDRLKAFHQYLVKNHRAPIVQYLYERQSDGLFLKTRLISPQMFQLMIRILRDTREALGLTEQDATVLEWVYTLAFRLGACVFDVKLPGSVWMILYLRSYEKHPGQRESHSSIRML